MEWDEIKDNLVKGGGLMAMKNAEAAATRLSKASSIEPWKGAILGMLADAVEKHGWEGKDKVEKVLDDIEAGREPDLGFVSLKTRSDVLASLQNAEADAKSAAKEFFIQVGKTLGVIIKAVIKGLL